MPGKMSKAEEVLPTLHNGCLMSACHPSSSLGVPDVDMRTHGLIAEITKHSIYSCRLLRDARAVSLHPVKMLPLETGKGEGSQQPTR